MKTFSLFATVLLLGVTLGAGDAEAKRLGSGKSIGMQRQATTPDKAPTPAAAPSATPSATPATAAAAAPAAGGAAAAAAKPRSSWMGPVAGLAAGLGLAALASHLGFGEELASMLLIGLLVVAVLAVVGFVMRRRAAAQAGSGFDRMQYAAGGADAGAPRAGGSAFERLMPGSAGGATAAAGAQVSAGTIPADFDAAGFARNAKVNFIRLQAAYDAANLDDIRAFTTPEVFAEIRMDLSERAGATQETDVVRIDAEVIEVAEEDNRYVVSVRFQGLVRESGEASPQAVDEIWHMTKPRDGSSGWVIAGIQQMQ